MTVRGRVGGGGEGDSEGVREGGGRGREIGLGEERGRGREGSMHTSLAGLTALLTTLRSYSKSNCKFELSGMASMLVRGT